MKDVKSDVAKAPKAKEPGGKPRTLGPVPNLEEHVPAEWWRRIFNSIYLKTDGDVVDDRAITAREVDLFTEILNLAADDSILDLCCGQGRHTLELARRDFTNVEGMDRSHYLIQRARSQARKEALVVRFREGDARKLPHPTDSFDAVMILGNSFGYFETVNDDLKVLMEVARLLKPWGKILLDVADGDYLRANFQPRSWEWIDPRHFVCRERSLSLDRQRLISREVVTHVEKGVLADQFYAERLYSQDSITELLRKAGFKGITVHSQISPDSKRNQDLGMMERRIIVSARIRKEWTPRRRRVRTELRNVTVVMGDPSRPDNLKPQGVFAEEDIFTIDQLKGALREVEGYHFDYLNNHSTMIADLARIKGKTDYVLNLCDEGFENDARKELHVAAMLEAMGIPYTGAGPQCMAFCYDKSLVRGVAREMGIPVPEALFIKPEDTALDLEFNFPVIVKPNLGDSSFGITQRSVASKPEELLDAVSGIREKFGYDKSVLVEEFLQGADLTMGIIGNPPESYQVLPIIEEDYSNLPDGLPKICGYEAKWMPDSPYWRSLKSVPANLPDEIEKMLVEWCTKLFDRLECRDYARFDWRLDSQGVPKLLEVNPNPGWCWDGHLAKMAGFAQISYQDMLAAILRVAEQRLGLESANGNGRK
ncbi:methyltransferase domain-containing protein [candidate division WOR-3 bacterium]|nr:methyltransferase domain-containing protein [candidate division WOR-3 bacterium]